MSVRQMIESGIYWNDQVACLGPEGAINRMAEMVRDDAERLGQPGLAGEMFRVTLASLRWMRCGFPRLVFGHKHAASLMATRVPVDVVSETMAPWASFLVDVPSGILTLDGFAVTGVLWAEVDCVGTDSIVVALSERGWSLCAIASSVGALAQIEHSDAAVVMIARYLLGAAIEASMHRPSCDHASGPRSVKKTPRGEPVTETFQLTRNVRVDARQAIRDYCSGSRSAPTIQSLVRGHWKMQPCGIGSVDRKFIHVEPYWRGPEDAPIAVRSHTFGSTINRPAA